MMYSKQIIHYKIEVPQINAIDSKIVWSMGVSCHFMNSEKTQVQSIEIARESVINAEYKVVVGRHTIFVDDRIVHIRQIDYT